MKKIANPNIVALTNPQGLMMRCPYEDLDEGVRQLVEEARCLDIAPLCMTFECHEDENPLWLEWTIVLWGQV